jgi:hypothetical protein
MSTTTTTVQRVGRSKRVRGGGKQASGEKKIITTRTTNVVANSPTGKQRKKRTNRVSTIVVPGPRISPCAINYAKVLANPWDSYGHVQNVCIPDDNDIPSFKFQVRLRGSMVPGSQLGYVISNPIAFASRGIPSVMLSNSTLTSPNVPNSGTSSGNLYANSPSIFDGGSAGTMPLIRCVAFGLRIRYSGTELNRGGSIIPFRARKLRDDSGTETLTANSFTSVAARGQSTVKPVERKWVGTVYTPNSNADREYLKVTETDFGVEFNSNSRKVGVLVTPAAASTFDYDVVGYYEAIEQSYNNGVVYSTPPPSASDSDVDGYSFIKDVYAKFSDSEMGQGAWDLFKWGAKHYASHSEPLGSAFNSLL